MALEYSLICTYVGKRCWNLAAQPLDFPEGLDKYKWFARFLLEGKVWLFRFKFCGSTIGVCVCRYCPSWRSLLLFYVAHRQPWSKHGQSELPCQSIWLLAGQAVFQWCLVRLHKRTEVLLLALVEKNVDSYSRLRLAFEVNRQCMNAANILACLWL